MKCQRQCDKRRKKKKKPKKKWSANAQQKLEKIGNESAKKIVKENVRLWILKVYLMIDETTSQMRFSSKPNINVWAIISFLSLATNILPCLDPLQPI